MPAAVELPPISKLHSASDLEQTAVLDALFEPSPEIHTTLLPVMRTGEYSDYKQLIDACHIKLLSLAASSTPEAPSATLLSVLGSHPRLGVGKVDSAQSVAEQAKLGGVSEELKKLNEEYEAAYPGLRFVVFVNGRGRPEIMHDMRVRIARNDYNLEVADALQAMCDIAKDRASKLPVKEHASASTDTARI